jgi:hypothetical protein
MKTEKKLLLIYISLVIILFIVFSIKVVANNITCNESLYNIQKSYNIIEKALSLGYNSNYISDLNSSINYLNIGINKNNLSYCLNSYRISNNILDNSSKILNNAMIFYYSQVIKNVLIISILFVLSYISYKFVPKIFWIAWLKTHENYEVKEND